MTYTATKRCCYVGYITQAVTINFAPLVFVIFQKNFNINYNLIGTLIFVNFLTQLIVDILSVFLIEKIGLKRAVLISQIACAAGMILLPVLPQLMNNKYLGICICIVIYSIGAGLIEVAINPVIAAIPQNNKNGIIFLHSFYCWGQLLVVLLSSIALYIFGNSSWVYIAPLWGIIPLINAIAFFKAPFPKVTQSEKRGNISTLFNDLEFIFILFLMICAGASELSMSQWASTYAQNALKVNKFIGDLLGPCLFALFMGIGRTLHGIMGERMNYKFHMSLNCILCMMCYVIAAFSKNSYIALFGCAFCGYTISIMWPGTVDLVTKKFPDGSDAMYSVIAIFGDVGCSIGPFLTGIFASMKVLGENSFKIALSLNIVFPLMFIILFNILIKSKKQEG